jgi:hypothetical protein
MRRISGPHTARESSNREPNEELSIQNFAISLHARAAAFARLGQEITVLEGNNGI